MLLTSDYMNLILISRSSAKNLKPFSVEFHKAFSIYMLVPFFFTLSSHPFSHVTPGRHLVTWKSGSATKFNCFLEIMCFLHWYNLIQYQWFITESNLFIKKSIICSIHSWINHPLNSFMNMSDLDLNLGPQKLHIKHGKTMNQGQHS